MISKSLIIVQSFHHRNTEKIAIAISTVLKSELKTPQNITPKEIDGYDLIGFGGGISHGHHYTLMINFVKTLPLVSNKKAYIFSTSGFKWTKKTYRDHSALREILISKGYSIKDEFNCLGFNTNSIFGYFFGGINKGKPNSKDFIKAQEFARNLINL